MKKTFFVFSLFALILITGCSSNERITKGVVEDYYKALINEDYDKVYEISRVYDLGERGTEKTSISEEEAKAFFEKKVDHLKKVDYKVKSYEISNKEQSDGHTFFYEVELEIEVNGETITRKEKVWPKVDQENIAIMASEDPFAKYRDGRMNFDIDEYWSEDSQAEYDQIF